MELPFKKTYQTEEDLIKVIRPELFFKTEEDKKAYLLKTFGRELTPVVCDKDGNIANFLNIIEKVNNKEIGSLELKVEHPIDEDEKKEN